MRGGLLDSVRFEARPERIVDAEYHAGDVGAHGESTRQLLALDVCYTRAAGGKYVQIRIDKAVGKKDRPASPRPAVGHSPDRVADAQRDGIAKRGERGHTRTSAPTAGAPRTR